MKKAIELNQIIGSKYIIMASAGKVTGVDGWKAVGDSSRRWPSKLRPLSMATGYHNHQPEWQPVDGKRPMDVLAASTPKDLVLQFDVGTCVEVGADPVAWINANPGRIKSMHCKDWGAGQGRGYAVAFGEGDVPWKKIFDAAEVSRRRGVLPDRAGREPATQMPDGAAVPRELEEAARVILSDHARSADHEFAVLENPPDGRRYRTGCGRAGWTVNVRLTTSPSRPRIP